MMQIILCSLIVLIAALYVANQWLPQQWKQRLFRKAVHKQSRSTCSACSSRGNCQSTNSAPKIVITPHK